MATSSSNAPGARIEFEVSHDIGPGRKRKKRSHVEATFNDEPLYQDSVLIDRPKALDEFLKSVEKKALEAGIPYDASQARGDLNQAVEGSQKSGEELPDRHADVLGVLEIQVVAEDEQGRVLIFSRGTKKSTRLVRVSSLKRYDLIQIVGAEKGKLLSMGGLTLDQVKTAVAEAASAAPRLASADPIGQGIHSVAKGYLMVNGDEVWIQEDGQIDWQRHEGPMYQNQQLDLRPNDPWWPSQANGVEWESAKEAFEWLQSRVTNAFHFAHPKDSEILAALVVATIIQGCWHRRPIVAINGPSNSGKTTLLTKLKTIFGPWTLLSDHPTEAGIRQSVRHDLRPILIDEAEECSSRSTVNQLLRTSTGGGSILKGTKDQEAKAYKLKHIVFVASIESGLLEEPDQNRRISLQLNRVPSGSAFEIAGEDDIEEWQPWVYALAIQMLPHVCSLAKELGTRSIKGIGQRTVECFAVPAAVSACVNNGPGATVDDAMPILESYLDGRQAEPIESAENGLLKEIMYLQLPVSAGPSLSSKVTVADILFGHNRNDKALESLGLGVVNPRGTNDRCLFVVPKLLSRNLPMDSPRQGKNIGQILLHLEGAQRNQVRFGAGRESGVTIPESTIRKILGTPNVEDDERSV